MPEPVEGGDRGDELLILASASARRRDLLAAVGLTFSVQASDVDEHIALGTEPEAAAETLARRKACAVAALHPGERARVIGADTVVALDTGDGPRLLGKPDGQEEARSMLGLLSGSRHRVVTGVAVVDCRADPGAEEACPPGQYARLPPRCRVSSPLSRTRSSRLPPRSRTYG